MPIAWSSGSTVNLSITLNAHSVSDLLLLAWTNDWRLVLGSRAVVVVGWSLKGRVARCWDEEAWWAAVVRVRISSPLLISLLLILSEIQLFLSIALLFKRMPHSFTYSFQLDICLLFAYTISFTILSIQIFPQNSPTFSQNFVDSSQPIVLLFLSSLPSHAHIMFSKFSFYQDYIQAGVVEGMALKGILTQRLSRDPEQRIRVVVEDNDGTKRVKAKL